MSFLEKHKNPDTFPTRATGLNSMNAYFKQNGLRLGKIIGEGSYSKVRLCIVTNDQDGPEQVIACKVISKRKASEDFVNKFLPRELDIVGRLSNPNIVTVFDVVEFDNHDHVFIFMDFCNKGDLLEFIKKKGFLSEKRTQNYFWQILSAVRYMHSLDLAHRDLKCENVLLCSGDVVKISDFGFSRYCHDFNGKRILSNTYCGSAAYAAPEILQGTQYNPKLYDTWSLGCILFIMLTGHMPYDESNVQQMLQNQNERILTYPHQVEGLISKQAKRLIGHLLEPDVTRRATIEHALSNSWFTSLKSKNSSLNVNGNNSGSGDGQSQQQHRQQPTSSREIPFHSIAGSCYEVFAQDCSKNYVRPTSTHCKKSKDEQFLQESSNPLPLPTTCYRWRHRFQEQ
ncbi:testis-specific serine/threonine-protein kinase 6 [Folsomia candida]|uniref:testis-specific serine/threonine-protein kinase 6 n=1 Tax=Folsomia candida TaxID=158441 RepID=UPI000B8FFCA6|nr:testis-specific serine/threonine-protein kinase 6 [Folsomia candida]